MPGIEGFALLTPLLLILALTLGFVKLARDVHVGRTQDLDEWILRSLRSADDIGVPLGPKWLLEVCLDVTAIGSLAVISLVILAVVGYVLLLRRWSIALYVVLGTTSGVVACQMLKYFMGRERPSVVPHLQTVSSLSFPSGHAMVSATVYLTLGVLLMQVLPTRALRLYCLSCGILLTFLVGVTRVFLGVHYPSDVLAGWMAGAAWALLWLAILQLFRTRNSRDQCRQSEMAN